MSKYTKNIGVKTALYEKLEDRKRPGQSFTGVIQELLNEQNRYKELKKELRKNYPEDAEEIIEKIEHS